VEKSAIFVREVNGGEKHVLIETRYSSTSTVCDIPSTPYNPKIGASPHCVEALLKRMPPGRIKGRVVANYCRRASCTPYEGFKISEFCRRLRESSLGKRLRIVFLFRALFLTNAWQATELENSQYHISDPSE